MSPEFTAFKDLYIAELFEHHAAEVRLINLMKNMPAAATDARLGTLMKLHAAQTKLHAGQLEWIDHLSSEAVETGSQPGPDFTHGTDPTENAELAIRFDADHRRDPAEIDNDPHGFGHALRKSA